MVVQCEHEKGRVSGLINKVDSSLIDLKGLFGFAFIKCIKGGGNECSASEVSLPQLHIQVRKTGKPVHSHRELSQGSHQRRLAIEKPTLQISIARAGLEKRVCLTECRYA